MGKSLKRRNKSGSQDAADGDAAARTGSRSKTDREADDKDTTAVDKEDAYNADDADDESSTTPTSTWKTVRSHPTFLALVFLVIPWLLSKQANQLYLVYPHRVNHVLDVLEETGLLYQAAGYRLRPAVAMTDARQLLVVGSMSSGTSQVAHDLRESLGLEVGHEDTDTTQYAVRDGSISWFHGIRFLNRPDAKDRARMTINICNVAWRIYSSDKMNFFHPWSNYGTELILFGPTEYDLPVFHPSFRTAYLKTCQATIFRELGCGMNGGGTCKLAPFQRTLLQTRQPWRIVTSLVTKYCNGGTADAPKSLLLLFQALYPDYSKVWFPSESESGDTSGDKLNVCAEQMASYVYLWYNDLMDSFLTLHQQQPGNFLVYPIEDTAICQVAAMAGFDVGAGEFKNDSGSDAVLYPPNIDKVNEFCQENPTVPFGNTQNQFNSRKNKKSDGGERSEKQEQKLDVETVRKAVSSKTEKMIDKLASRMGY